CHQGKQKPPGPGRCRLRDRGYSRPSPAFSRRYSLGCSLPSTLSRRSHSLVSNLAEADQPSSPSQPTAHPQFWRLYLAIAHSYSGLTGRPESPCFPSRSERLILACPVLPSPCYL